jgi:hypothetical protein
MVFSSERGWLTADRKRNDSQTLASDYQLADNLKP